MHTECRAKSTNECGNATVTYPSASLLASWRERISPAH